MADSTMADGIWLMAWNAGQERSSAWRFASKA